MLPAQFAQLDILQRVCGLLNVYRNRARGEVANGSQLWQWVKGASMHEASVVYHAVFSDQAAHLSDK